MPDKGCLSLGDRFLSSRRAVATYRSSARQIEEDIVSRPLLHVELREDGSAGVIAVAGEMDISSAGDVRQVIYRALRHCPETLTLDLSEISFCDSTGVHLVLQAHRKATAYGTRFQILLPTGSARRVFDLCCVADYVTVLDGDADTAHPSPISSTGSGAL